MVSLIKSTYDYLTTYPEQTTPVKEEKTRTPEDNPIARGLNPSQLGETPQIRITLRENYTPQRTGTDSHNTTIQLVEKMMKAIVPNPQSNNSGWLSSHPIFYYKTPTAIEDEVSKELLNALDGKEIVSFEDQPASSKTKTFIATLSSGEKIAIEVLNLDKISDEEAYVNNAYASHYSKYQVKPRHISIAPSCSEFVMYNRETQKVSRVRQEELESLPERTHLPLVSIRTVTADRRG